MMSTGISPGAKAHNGEGSKWLDKDEFHKAIAEYSEAIRIRPDYPAPYYNRANALHQLGDLKHAIDDFTRSLHLSPDAATYVERGKCYHEVGDQPAALADFAEALHLDPNYIAAHFYRALLHEDRKDYDSALADLNQAITIGSKDPDELASLYFNRAIIYRRLDRYDDALADLDQAATLTPKDAEIYNLRGSCWFLKGDKQRALMEHERAIQLAPDDAAAYVGRGLALWETKQDDWGAKEYDRVIADMTKGLQYKFSKAAVCKVLTIRGLAFREKGDLRQARRDLDQALAIKADDPEALNARSRTRQLLGDLSGALADINAAVAIQPGSAQFLSNRAGVYISMGQFDKAISDSQEAIRLAPEYALGHYHLAVAQSRKGNEQEARTSFAEAFRLDPSLELRQRKPEPSLLRGLIGGLTRRSTQDYKPIPQQEAKPNKDKIIMDLTGLLANEKIEEIYAYVASHIRWFDREFMRYLAEHAMSPEAKAAGATQGLTILRQAVEGARFTTCLGNMWDEKLSAMVSDPALNETAADKFVRDLLERYGEAGPDAVYACFSEMSQSADALGGSPVDRRNLHLLLDAACRYGAGK